MPLCRGETAPPSVLTRWQPRPRVSGDPIHASRRAARAWADLSVILSPAEFAPWLDAELTDPEQLWPMLDQYPAEEMTAYPVSTLVGSVRNDSPELIVPSE